MRLSPRLKSLQWTGVALLLSLTAAAGCAPTTQVHGYMPPPEDIARIRPGFDDTGSVEEILGRPSSNGVLRDSAWYYVQTRVESFTCSSDLMMETGTMPCSALCSRWRVRRRSISSRARCIEPVIRSA